MADQGLFRPDNRTLGGSPGDDLSLYALPEAAIAAPYGGAPLAAVMPSALAFSPGSEPAFTSQVRAAEALPLGHAAAPAYALAAAPHTQAPSLSDHSARGDDAVTQPLGTGSLTPRPPQADHFGGPDAYSTHAPATHAPALAAPVIDAPVTAGGVSLPVPTATPVDPQPQHDGIAPSLSEASGDLAAAAVSVAEPVLHTAEAAVYEAVVDIVPAIGEAADNVQDLVGSDPAGGIATLVSLVSVSDVLDLRNLDDGTPAPAEGATDLIDTLVVDVEHDAPLPVPVPEHHDDHPGGPLPGVPDPHDPLDGLGL